MNLAQAFFGGLLVLGIILKLRAKKSAVHQLKPIEPRYHHTAALEAGHHSKRQLRHKGKFIKNK